MLGSGRLAPAFAVCAFVVCSCRVQERAAIALPAGPPPRAPGALAYAGSAVPRPVFPVRDSDRDGVNDAYDACPSLPGLRSATLVVNGCPPPGYYDDGLGRGDRDGDGVADGTDACPDAAGVPAASATVTGCPEAVIAAAARDELCRNPASREAARAAGCPLAWMDGERIRVLDNVSFASGSSHLLEASGATLDAVAAILAEHAELEKIEVSGHTDAVGGAERNRALGKRRARVVVERLVGRGVAAGRLEARGAGPDEPVAPNDAEAGRAENRRVEFRVLSRVAPTGAVATSTSAPAAPAPAVPAPAAPAPVVPAPATPAPTAPAAPAAVVPTSTAEFPP